MHDHKSAAPSVVRCAVVTVSDTRTEADDKSGSEIKRLLTTAGHSLARSEIIPDDASRIVAVVHEITDDSNVDAVVLTGGTGVAPRDCTYEAVVGLLTKRLDGFGELFRMISYEEIGPAAMLSRAVAGVIGNTALFALPGSTGACRTAMEKLILPELAHLVSLANPDRQGA